MTPKRLDTLPRETTTDRRSQRREARREVILEAASAVFFESGFAGASVDDVIARVGGSKRTLYAWFGNKEELFAAVVEELTGRILAPLAEERPFRGDPEAVLSEVGRHYLDVIMSPDALKLYRTIIAEGARFPRLAQSFFDCAPGRVSGTLARALAEAHPEIPVADCERGAEKFVGMIRDDLHLKVVLGLRPPPDRMETDATVRRAVAIFVHGWPVASAGWSQSGDRPRPQE